MRRLVPFLVLGLATLSFGDSVAYLKLRAQHGITQAVGTAALRNVSIKPRVLELQGKIVGTCQATGTTTLIFQRSDGETQEIEAKSPPEWLGETGADVRLLIRCIRAEKGGSLRSVLLAAAPELDVLPAEEAYWRHKAEISRRASVNKPVASRSGMGRSNLRGAIGRAPAPSSRDWVLPADEVTPRYAAFIRGRNPRLSSDEAMRIAQAIVGFSIRYRVDARLVMAMVIVESDFDPNAVSRAGAVGLGQLMPGTAQWMGVRNSYDTTDNLYGMVKLLRTHLNQYNDLALTLAAYNAGGGAVRRHGGVPPYRETQAYVRRVTDIYRQLCGA